MGQAGRGKSSKPGILVLGTRIGAGKTLVAATLCLLLRQRAIRVGAFKPIDFACQRRQRQGLVSPDAEILSHFADSVGPPLVRAAWPIGPEVDRRLAGHVEGVPASL